MYYVYLIQILKDESLYLGYTNNLKRRFYEHNNGENKSTKLKIPYRLVYYEAYYSKSDAKHREGQLKNHGGAMTHLKKRACNSLTLSEDED